MDHRKALLDKLVALSKIDADHFPVVTLDEFFTGNTDEESIAPNQWGFGRPPIRDIYERFKQVAARSDVYGVFVGLHQDWAEALKYDSQWPGAENIHVFSTAPQEVADEWIAGLESDGVGEGWPYGKHAASPEVPEGAAVYTVYWD